MNFPCIEFIALTISVFLASSESYMISSGNECKNTRLHSYVLDSGSYIGNVVEVYLRDPNVAEEMYRENCDGKSPMHLAVDKGDTCPVAWFINADFDVHHRFSKGNTIMIYAAGQGKKLMLETLLEFGSSVDDMNEDESTPLFEAVKSMRKDICELLIGKGSDIGRRFSGGDGYLHRFVENGTTEQVGLLVKLGAPIGMMNDQGLTAVHKAVSRGRIAILNIFLAEYKSTNCKNITNVWEEPLEYAVRNGIQRVLAHLMDQLISNSCWYKYTKGLMDEAVGEGNFTKVDMIFTNRNKDFLEAFGWDSLNKYASRNNTIALEYLFGKGFKLKSRDVIPLLSGSLRILMNPTIVKLIVSHSTPFDVSDLESVIAISIMYISYIDKGTDVVEYLLEARDDTNLTYQTPL